MRRHIPIALSPIPTNHDTAEYTVQFPCHLLSLVINAPPNTMVQDFRVGPLLLISSPCPASLFQPLPYTPPPSPSPNPLEEAVLILATALHGTPPSAAPTPPPPCRCHPNALRFDNIGAGTTFRLSVSNHSDLVQAALILDITPRRDAPW